MWARVKGRTENELLAMPMTAYMFRPGYIQPVNGPTSRTPIYRILYRATGALYPLLRRAFPRYITNTDTAGRAMLAVTRQNSTGPTVLRNPSITSLRTDYRALPLRRTSQLRDRATILQSARRCSAGWALSKEDRVTSSKVSQRLRWV
ncbi:hypothetical protein [Streptomyces sp. NPDC046939]|uniref:hypothetical protein n=1 Tax=Streptomyces sp. NPDC046939 TaxID=3155376 RepID=UPI0033EE989A